MEDPGLEGATSGDPPMIEIQSGEIDSDCPALRLRDATLYRRLVFKLNYLATDRPDIRWAASIMGSHTPQARNMRMWSNSKEKCEYCLGDRPLGRTSAGGRGGEGERSDHTMAYTDSDWAASREEKRSMGGKCLSTASDSRRFRCGKMSCTLRGPLA